jgi:hypothetical protein
MNTNDRLTMITESTFDRHMKKSMERLEEMLHRGERVVEVDIREMLHILGRTVSLAEDRARMEAILFGNLNSYRDHFNRSVSTPCKVPVDPLDQSKGFKP